MNSSTRPILVGFEGQILEHHACHPGQATVEKILFDFDDIYSPPLELWNGNTKVDIHSIQIIYFGSNGILLFSADRSIHEGWLVQAFASEKAEDHSSPSTPSIPPTASPLLRP